MVDRDALVERMVERFRAIGEETMKDLPVYNARLKVEAVDFRPWYNDQMFGALVTPWFINLILLPVAHRPWDAGPIGTRTAQAFPAGETVFEVNGDPELGMFLSRSVRSPLGDVKSQDAARRIAEAAIDEAVTMRDPPSPEPEQESRAGSAPKAKGKAAVARRDLLRGRFRGRDRA